jgi:hypothetical protein
MHHDPVELVGVTIHHAAEAVAVLLFIGDGRRVGGRVVRRMLTRVRHVPAIRARSRFTNIRPASATTPRRSSGAHSAVRCCNCSGLPDGAPEPTAMCSTARRSTR